MEFKNQFTEDHLRINFSAKIKTLQEPIYWRLISKIFVMDAFKHYIVYEWFSDTDTLYLSDIDINWLIVIYW